MRPNNQIQGSQRDQDRSIMAVRDATLLDVKRRFRAPLIFDRYPLRVLYPVQIACTADP